MIYRSKLIPLAIVMLIILLPDRADAFSLDDIQLNTDGNSSSQCNNDDINNSLDKIYDVFTNNIRSQILEEFKPLNALQFLWKKIEARIWNMTIYGNGGAGSLGVNQSGGGEIESILKSQWKDALKQKFLDSCQSQDMLDKIRADANAMIMQNGRDGGPVFVQNWDDFINQSQNRGVEIARNQMAHTRYCPWVQGDMQGIFNFSSTDAVDLVGESVDSGGSSVDANSCSLQSGADPYDPSQQGSDMLAALTQPQNNVYGSYLSGLATINSSVQKASLADQYEYVYTGGFGAFHSQNPQTGDSCLTRAKNGTCLQYSSIVQPGGGVLSGVQAQDVVDRQAVNSAGATTDVRTKIAASYLDRTQPPMVFQYSLSLGLDALSNTPKPTPSPTPTPPSTNPACSTVPTGCSCVVDDPQSQVLAEGMILPVEQSVISAHRTSGDLVTSDGISVLPGKNIAFLSAICADQTLSAICQPRAGSTTELVVNVGGIYVSVDIITPTGVIRQPGQVIAACAAGQL